MAFSVEFMGILFVEGPIDGFRALAPVEIEIGEGYSHAQLQSLRNVKSIMAEKAKAAGGNCICDFKYGQRSGGFWKGFTSLDEVFWYGSGVIGLIDK